MHCNIGFHLFTAPHSLLRSRILERIESFVSVPNKRQTHLSILLGRQRLGLPLMDSSIVLLWNLVDREIADIDIRREFGLKRSSDPTQLVPDDTLEKRMPLDLGSAIMCSTFLTQTIGGVTEKTIQSA